jgi:N-acetylglucosaminyl-diphospho-decaprenol L-rhamnosyltransferase
VRDRVAAVVVSYRTPRLAAALAHGLAPQMPVLVVECGPLGQGAYASSCHGVDVIVAGRNVGFGAAVNAGAKRSPSTPYLLVLNADVDIAASDVARLADRLDADPSLAAVAPTLVDAAGTARLNARAFPRLRDAVVTRRRRLRAGEARPSGYVDWLSGACILFRRADFDAAGGFDSDRYFLYWEDADIAWRLARRERRLAVAGDVEARHHEGASGRSLGSIYHFHRSAWLLRRRMVPGRLDGIAAAAALGFRGVVLGLRHLVAGSGAGRIPADRPDI